LLPRFNSHRMVAEYVSRFYVPASLRGQHLGDNNYRTARDLAAWKRKVRGSWPHIVMQAIEMPKRHAGYGERARVIVGIRLDKLEAQDVHVELMLTNVLRAQASREPPQAFFLHPEGAADGGVQRYVLDLPLESAGKLEYRIRAYPHHPALSHVYEM